MGAERCQPRCRSPGINTKCCSAIPVCRRPRDLRAPRIQPLFAGDPVAIAVQRGTVAWLAGTDARDTGSPSCGTVRIIGVAAPRRRTAAIGPGRGAPARRPPASCRCRSPSRPSGVGAVRLAEGPDTQDQRQKRNAPVHAIRLPSAALIDPKLRRRPGAADRAFSPSFPGSTPGALFPAGEPATPSPGPGIDRSASRPRLSPSPPQNHMTARERRSM